jgi:hypothetical protein
LPATTSAHRNSLQLIESAAERLRVASIACRAAQDIRITEKIAAELSWISARGTGFD